MRIDIKRTAIYKEFDKETNKKYFDTKGNAILENVDSLYYGVFLAGDTNDSFALGNLFTELNILKEVLKDTNELQFFKDLEVKHGNYAKTYSYRLSNPDLFDIFISDHLPNTATPRIVIQLRSYGLWLHGVEHMLELSFNKLKEILEDYEVTICRTQENRFDYAYHTNMIQNSKKFFADEKLLKHCVTSMRIYSKVGNANLNDNDDNRELEIDYFSLGSRNSNNVFIRIYNKTREVIENGYKAFFIEYWYQNRMISFYDKYCIEIAYKEKRYDALEKARLHFYLDYGTDASIKYHIVKLISNKNSRCKDFKDFADTILPKITIVNNIEFETKRNFYRFVDKQIDGIFKTTCTNELGRIYKIYHNRDVFLKYLTNTTLYFVQKIGDPKYQSWWNRIVNKKLANCNNTKAELLRKYSKEIDFDAALTRSINAIGTANIYKNRVDTDLVEDFSAMLGMLNDNDLNNMDKKIAFVDSATGEIIEYLDEKISLKYKETKQKKYSQRKNRIPSSLPDPQESTIQTDR